MMLPAWASWIVCVDILVQCTLHESAKYQYRAGDSSAESRTPIFTIAVMHTCRCV